MIHLFTSVSLETSQNRKTTFLVWRPTQPILLGNSQLPPLLETLPFNWMPTPHPSFGYCIGYWQIPPTNVYFNGNKSTQNALKSQFLRATGPSECSTATSECCCSIRHHKHRKSASLQNIQDSSHDSSELLSDTTRRVGAGQRCILFI